MSTLNETPSANRLHIGFFGKRNSGKSSLMNTFTGQEVSIVSDIAGTTTDVVTKAMEIHGLGACVLLDTAGFDDVGELGEIRVEKTKKAFEKVDIALLLFSSEEMELEVQWYKKLKEKKIPTLAIINKIDILKEEEQGKIAELIKKELKLEPLLVSALEKSGMEQLKEAIVRLIPEEFGEQTITGDLVKEGDTVFLVMPLTAIVPRARLTTTKQI